MIMKKTYIFAGFLALFVTTMFMASCLNDDNKIPENCYDGIENNGEENVDCGGPCPLCDPCENGIWDVLLGEQCVDCGGDCGACLPCHNCIQDGDETGVDCGGSCGILCAELCGDGLMNGNEEEIDCGGPDCDPCPTCTDGILNGEEIGIDCGGLECPPCATDGNCTNNVLDGDEADIDCGGTICPPCENSFMWKVDNVQKTADFAATATITGGVISISGTTGANESIAFTIPEPLGDGWVNGAGVIFNMANAPAHLGAFTSIDVTVFATSVGAANITMTVATVNAISGGHITGTFSGTMMTLDEATTVNISNGEFVLNIE
jgi:hypothetical protein